MIVGESINIGFGFLLASGSIDMTHDENTMSTLAIHLNRLIARLGVAGCPLELGHSHAWNDPG